MNKSLIFLTGFLLVASYAPMWSQPAMEPKTLLLFLAGGISCFWMLWRRQRPIHLPWVVFLPLLWLLVSSLWSPSPFLGLLRLQVFLAALLLISLLQDEAPWSAFMQGILSGTALHAGVIFAQSLPMLRPHLPVGLDFDPYQGVGRGLFHNTNMAAQPLLWCITGILLAPKDSNKPRPIHLVWLLPALALTHSRLAIAIGAATVAFTATRQLLSAGGTLLPGMMILGSLALGLSAHQLGWLLPLGAALAAWKQSKTEVSTSSTHDRASHGGQLLVIGGLLVALSATFPSLPTFNPKNQPRAEVGANAGDHSLSQRKHYARASILAIAEQPIWGQGLGSFRALYPKFVAPNRPAIETAYGDFKRPNNPHSEPLEWVLEGGAMLVGLMGLGLWLDRRNGVRLFRPWLLWPLGLLSLMDFPLHYPIGLTWFAAGLAIPPKTPTPPRFLRLQNAGLLLAGSAFLAWSASLAVVAQRRTGTEAKFVTHQNPQESFQEARKLWRRFPGSADLFDLYSKSAVQAASSPGSIPAHELDTLLELDPNDHHLLLARAQMAVREGDRATAARCLAQYQQVAPPDPGRYLRLAEDAIRAGKSDAAAQLIARAHDQPGFNVGHREWAERILAPLNPHTAPPTNGP